MYFLQDATLPDIKKAYRTLSKQLHPDKNDAPDAEIKFRQVGLLWFIEFIDKLN